MKNSMGTQYLYGGCLYWKGKVQFGKQRPKSVEIPLCDFFHLDEYKDKGVINDLAHSLVEALLAGEEKRTRLDKNFNCVLTIDI